MTPATVLGRIPQYERLERLGKALPRECGDALSWATRPNGGPSSIEPEPSCVHGGWAPALDGRPTQLVGVGSLNGVYLWRSFSGWHLTVVAPAGTVVTGSIMTDGIVAGIVHHLLPLSTVRTDAIDGGLRFRIAIADGTAGFDFRVGCGSSLTFTSFVGSRRLDPTELFMGTHGAHPEQLPFEVRREVPAGRGRAQAHDITIQL